MKRHIPGLHHENRSSDDVLEGVFLVRVDRAFYRWHPQRPFFFVRFNVLEPKEHQAHSFTGPLYCTPRALWKLNWFLRDFGYDPDLMGRDEVDEKALVGLRGIVLLSQTLLNGHSFPNLDGFGPAADWETAPVFEARTPETHRDI